MRCVGQTKHFLLIGFLGMFIGSIVFCYLSFKKKENKMQVGCACAWFFVGCLSSPRAVP